MKAIILCGGRGTRLREHTQTRPKPMVEIGGRPILWHIMKTYAEHGITDFVLCLGYMSHMIKDYFLNFEARSSDFTVELGPSLRDGKGRIEFHGSAFDETGWKITLADTGESANTGARVLRGARYLDKDDTTFAVTYGDGVADIDLAQALAFHRANDAVATVTGVRPPSRYGELEADGDRVLSFSEKPQVTEGLINGGYFFFERPFLDYLKDEESCSLEANPLEDCAADGKLFVYRHPGYWQCMDTLRDWEQLEARWNSGHAPWRIWK